MRRIARVMRERHARRPPGRGERGATMVVAMVVLMALLLTGAMTTIATRSTLAAAGHDRFRTMALYAAESGVAAAYAYLRAQLQDDSDPDRDNWGLLFSSSDPGAAASPADLPGNDLRSGEDGAILSESARTWFHVDIFNNPNDPGYAAGRDTDGIVLLEVSGHAPRSTVVQVSVEVRANGNFPVDANRPCPSYAQEALAEDGSGRNDCLGQVTGTAATTVTFHPGT